MSKRRDQKKGRPIRVKKKDQNIKSITKPETNEGRKSFVDMFIDDWSGSLQQTIKASLYTAIIGFAYFGLVTQPSSVADWAKIALIVAASEVILIGIAYYLNGRRVKRMALMEKLREAKSNES